MNDVLDAFKRIISVMVSMSTDHYWEICYTYS